MSWCRSRERLDGVAEVVLDVLADAPHAVPGNLTALLSDPTQLSAAQEVLGGKSLNELMTDSYAQLITLPSARESYRRFFRGLLGEDTRHCSTAPPARTGRTGDLGRRAGGAAGPVPGRRLSALRQSLS